MNFHQVSPEVLSELRIALSNHSYWTKEQVQKLSDDELLSEVAGVLRYVSDPYNHYTSCAGPCDC